MAIEYLQVWDYVIIVGSLMLTSMFGLYYGISRKESKGTTFEYLLASRNIGMIPIAFSYYASLTSSGVIIGHPAEVYAFGMQIIMLAVTVVPCTLVLNEVFIPIFHKLASGSVYEYLEIRFNGSIKNLVTTLAVLQTVVLSSANVYGPSTVLSQVTGLSTWFIVVVMSVLCIIYTTLGGIRAVILADVVQALLMFLSIILLLAFGIYFVGDYGLILKRNSDTDRLNIFQFDFDVNVRLTFWNTTFGYFFTFMALTATSQFLVQRFMTAPTVAVAKRANILGNFLFILTLFLVQSLGLVMYATFHGCDPLKSGLIQNMDQLLPAYLTKILSSYVMLPGIIFSGILCACLTTLSSVYNSTATIIMASFVRPSFPHMTDKLSTVICKLLVLSVGILSTAGVAVAELFPNVLQSVLSIYSAVSAPLLGMLFIGIFCPQANIKAACISFVSSVCFLFYVIAGTLLVKPKLVTKPLSADECQLPPFGLDNYTIAASANFTDYDYEYDFDSVPAGNATSSPSVDSSEYWSTYFPLSSMSYLWYSTVGTIMTFLIFIVLSLILGKEADSVTEKPNIVPDIVKRLHLSLPPKWRKVLLCDVYSDVLLLKSLKGDQERDRVTKDQSVLA